MEGKSVNESKTEQVQIITQSDLNGYGRLFGGQLMKWIDIVAAVAARRHAGKNVTTVLVDTLSFKEPAYANDLIVLRAKVTYTANTSMEVCVRSYVESLDGMRRLINTAYFVMVALDENEKPTKVPPLILKTERDKLEWEAAKKRYELRKKRREEVY